jgi:hypothetical protein
MTRAQASCAGLTRSSVLGCHNTIGPTRLLCARRERPSGRRAAEKRDERASPHGLPSSDWRPHITTPLRENAAVDHSKIDHRMAEMGHERPKVDVRVESVRLPTADIGRRGSHGRQVPRAIIRAFCQTLSRSCQGSSYVANAADEVLHYVAYHSVLQRDDPDEPWLNRKIDRQYFD